MFMLTILIYFIVVLWTYSGISSLYCTSMYSDIENAYEDHESRPDECIETVH